MAQYNVKTKLLDDAGEDFSSLANHLVGFCERLESIKANLSVEAEIPQQIVRTKDSISSLISNSSNIGKALHIIADYYCKAECTAMGGIQNTRNAHIVNRQGVVLPIIKQQSDSIVLDRLPLPDWLVLAMINKESKS